MSISKKVFFALLAIVAILIVPYIGARINFNGQFPENYFDFPTLSAPEKEGFSWFMFSGVMFFFVLVFFLFLFPRWFGFKNIPAEERKVTKVSLPVWFWVGVVMFLGTLLLLWGKFSEPKWLINWAVIPLFWGFTLILDGWVYVRKGGRSYVNNAPQELLGIGMASIGGWLIFEFLDFFIDVTWYYPFGNLISEAEFFTYALIGSSGLLPMAFEWYSLFNTFPKFRKRYAYGIKIVFPKGLKIVLLVLSFVGLALSAHFHDSLFFVIWISPLFILAILLDFLGVWTPFKPVAQGNWTPMLLMALAYLLQGFLCEFWNYFSATHEGGNVITHNPDFWVYSLPYVNDFHIFEMPAAGFFGYLPFGIYCAVWWAFVAFLLNIPSNFFKEDHFEV